MNYCPLRHDVLADVARVIAGTPVASPAELQVGDVLQSRWAPGTYLTVTNTPRHFLGEVIVDFVSEASKHGTLHLRADLPAGRLLATRPAERSVRIRIEFDDDADLSYLDQAEFADVDPASITSWGVIVETACGCCDTWSVVDSVWGCDLESSTDWTGAYAVAEVPEPLRFALEHFDL